MCGHAWEATKKHAQMVEIWWCTLCRAAAFDGASKGDPVRLSLRAERRWYACAGAHQKTPERGTNLVVSPLPQRILRTRVPRETCCAHLGVATCMGDHQRTSRLGRSLLDNCLRGRLAAGVLAEHMALIGGPPTICHLW